MLNQKDAQHQGQMAFKTFGGRNSNLYKKHKGRHSQTCTAMIFKWWLFRRTALLPNTKNLIGKKNYRPITCLNTSYKILTSLVKKYMREHTTVNKIWNERKLEAAEGLLSTVDQLIIDICITEEVKRESSQPGSSLLQLQKGI